MEGSATVHIAAPADKIWDLIADVRNTGRFSPEVMEGGWAARPAPPSEPNSAAMFGETR
jgi:hypothetical protein